MSDFMTFEELFRKTWNILGEMTTKERQPYRKSMYKVAEMIRKRIVPSTYWQDKLYKIYLEVSEPKEDDSPEDEMSEAEKLKADKSRLPPGRLFRYGS